LSPFMNVEKLPQFSLIVLSGLDGKLALRVRSLTAVPLMPVY
jgi:hypothetical protein